MYSLYDVLKPLSGFAGCLPQWLYVGYFCGVLIFLCSCLTLSAFISQCLPLLLQVLVPCALLILLQLILRCLLMPEATSALQYVNFPCVSLMQINQLRSKNSIKHFLTLYIHIHTYYICYNRCIAHLVKYISIYIIKYMSQLFLFYLFEVLNSEFIDHSLFQRER